MKTGCLNNEILYNLYPAHTITKCLDFMGIKSITNAFVTVIICKEGEDIPILPGKFILKI